MPQPIIPIQTPSEQIAALQGEITSLRESLNFYKTRSERVEAAYHQISDYFKQLQRQMFGSKSERYIDSDSPQGLLFDGNGKITSEACNNPENLSESQSLDSIKSSAEDKKSGDNDNNDNHQDPDKNTGEHNESAYNSDDTIEVKAHIRKRNQKILPKDLPRREVIISAEDRICGCGKVKILMRYETTELLNFVPASFEIIEQKREILACPDACEGSVTTAPNPKRLLPKTSVTESFLAQIIVSKLHDRQPLYHQSKSFELRNDLKIHRSNLARWFIGAAKAVQPLINLLKDEIMDYDIAACDPTSIQVLKEPGRKATTDSYWYCMRGGAPDKFVIYYDYNALKHKQFLTDWFDGFEGYLHVDGQNIFDGLTKAEKNGKKGNNKNNQNSQKNQKKQNKKSKIQLIYCHAHGRRKFEPIANATKYSDSGLAKIAMNVYHELYRIEREAKDQKMTPEMRYHYRQERAKPLLDKYKLWLDKQYPTTLEESSIGKAIYYTASRWDGMTKYLNDGRLEIDNNLTEQQIKPCVISRKNFLFASSINGAKALCTHMTLIRTAIHHNLEPYAYLNEIFQKIPTCKTIEDYEKLLPWNIGLRKVGENRE